MTTLLPGINGALFPIRYLADQLGREVAGSAAVPSLTPNERQLHAWWKRVAASCGPATGLRALFDVVAMPLFGWLGFRASDALFDRAGVRARLTTRRHSTVGLLVLPWASRPSTAWRSAVSAASEVDASWCFVLAPPFLSLVATRGCALRRSLDFALPDVFGQRSLPVFLTLAIAEAFDRPEGAAVATIESHVATAALFQDQVRTDLQDGVVTALALLSEVLPVSKARPSERFDEALTLIYRILFLLFAESRDLLPRDHPIYDGAYAIGELCREAQRRTLTTDLWDGLAAITRMSRVGCEVDDLIVRPFNGRLFARQAAPSLEQRSSSRRRTRASAARDAAMQKALVALATRPGPSGREEICYTDLGVEQLGAVYERVLDIEPAHVAAARPSLSGGRHSQRRKESGTFYTPKDLAEFVVRRTLAPLVVGRSADRILALRVVDPAMGSGAFLVAACRYLASAYERALVDEGRCSDADLDADARGNIRRLVAERCLAGVDVNPVAVQLARLSLWLATLARGKPLGFLDHRLRAGNSLIGASPDVLRHTGDLQRSGPTASLPLFADLDLEQSLCEITRRMIDLSARRDDTVDDVRAKESIWRTLASDRSPIARWRVAASLWCARWFWPTSATAGEPIGPPPSPSGMRAAIDALLRNDRTLGAAQLTRWLVVARSLDDRIRFFHWPLEFPDVFYDDAGRARSQPGFDAVIGNPPWEMVRREPGAGLIGFPGSGIPDQNRCLVKFIRESGLYPSCDRGHLNLYQPFLERALSLARAGGRVGLVLPWGLAVDDGGAALRARLLGQAATDTIVGLDNAAGLFPIHRGLRFLVIVASPGSPTREFRARFGVRTREEIASLADADDDGRGGQSSYPVRLSPALIEAVGGSARRIPDVRHSDWLAFAERLTRSHPRLGAADGWNVRFGRELNVTDDRKIFTARGLPVIEGKHIQPFTVDVDGSSLRVERAVAARRLPAAGFGRPRLAYRDVSGVTNRLSLIAAVVPQDVVTTHTLFCLRTPQPIDRQHFLCAIFNSFALNALVRMLMGGHLTTSLVESLPVPVWTGSPAQRRIARLARRLSVRPHARTGARLQAAVARQYGIDIEMFRSLLTGFPLVPVKERTLAIDMLAGTAPPIGRARNTGSSRT